MAILQTKKQTDIEKRLKILRQQIYGKKEFRVEDKTSTNYELPTTNSTDISYLYQDLAKIGILATFALAAQIILFYLLSNNLLRINFF